MPERGTKVRVAIYEFEGEYVDVLLLGDLHLGTEESEYEKVIETVEKFQDTKIILLGDLIDNAIADSLGDVYSQVDNPHNAVKTVSHFLSKYKSRILGVIGGNHERRTWRKVGVDPIGLMCEQFGIPYSDDLMIVDLNIKNQKGQRGSRNRTNYAIACHHGTSGGRFPEKSIRQHRYFQNMITNVDIYLTGHTHIPQTSKSATYEYDPHNKKIRVRNIQHITIPAWVQEKYARQKLLPPSPHEVLLIRLYGGRNKRYEVYVKG